LALGFADVPIFLELCCRKTSTFGSFLKNRPVVHIGIDETLDIRKKETQVFVREVLRINQKGTTVWISTPCTAGCQLRHLNLTKEGYHEKWQKHFVLHQQLWRGVHAALKESDPSVTLMVQEWPEYNSLWSDNTYRKIAVKLGLVRGNLKVRRCCLDSIMKVWEIASNSPSFLEFCRNLLPLCKCNVKSHTIPYEETGYYSSAVCRFFWNVLESFMQKRWAAHVTDRKPLLPCLTDDAASAELCERPESFGSKCLALTSSVRFVPSPESEMAEQMEKDEIKIGCSVRVVNGDYEGRRGLVVRVTDKKAVVQFDDQVVVDLEAPPEQRCLWKTNLKVREPRPEVNEGMVGENWDQLKFRCLMPAPGSEVYSFEDVAQMRKYGGKHGSPDFPAGDDPWGHSDKVGKDGTREG